MPSIKEKFPNTNNQEHIKKKSRVYINKLLSPNLTIRPLICADLG